MAGVANFLFATEVGDIRPQTTNIHGNRGGQPEISPYLQLKSLKEKSRSLKKEYLQQKVSHHKVNASLEKINHQSLIKRIEFLKIYGNKKAKFQGQELLESKKHERERFQRKSVDMVKRKKLQYELQNILRQNQAEDHIYQLQLTNKKNKEMFEKQLAVTNQREQAYKLHDQIRRGNNEFVIRKRDMSTSITMRSKKNYISKINQELTVIQHYESILNEVEQFVTLTDLNFSDSKMENETMCQTMERGKTLFLTSKNTIE